ncbi:uncharacterized protein DSM5745_04859 [Aspergillus mulundensis]|uniref:CorA family metal ion transporter n=1 Tax=Aspergillus mulundensis TaxID=1810919 RepID=A0A3D8S4T2_9EURO|nr:Uncharacterized protein DSM5745_04859 [Aspergillus mulundensis]RDW81302.1 Uncharacterized protein DSM5745_04859 [Aspergillus mulundensis]
MPDAASRATEAVFVSDARLGGDGVFVEAAFYAGGSPPPPGFLVFHRLSSSFIETEARQDNNPCLAGLDEFLSEPNSDRRRCRILQLDFPPDTEGADPAPAFQDVGHENLRQSVDPAGEVGRRRILIIEDLQPEIILTLGNAHHIDPVFFASHLHAPFRQIKTQTPNLATLPSRIRYQNFINFHYHRAVELRGPIENEHRLTRDMNVNRKIAVLVPTEDTRIALVQHACSVILLNDRTGPGWLCVILVDSPISKDYIPVVYDKQREDGKPGRIDSRLFLEGYEDFMPPSPIPLDFESTLWRPQLSRESLLEDIGYYWRREVPEHFDSTKPTLFALTYYPLRIIAAEWNNYMAAMSYHIKRHEYAVEKFNEPVSELDKLYADLRILQVWRRRSLASQQKIAAIEHFVALNTPSQSSDSDESLENANILQEDFRHLASTLNDLSRRLRNMLPVVTSLVQISDSRRSLAESANVNRLTSLAIVFAPLSFTTGLFSMDDSNGPGGSHFWVFFAVAIPITLVVFLVAKPPRWLLRWALKPSRASTRSTQMQV